MVKLTPQSMRTHPLKSALYFIFCLAPGLLLGTWLFGSDRFNAPFVVTVIVISVLGGLTYGYLLKSYYNGPGKDA